MLGRSPADSACRSDLLDSLKGIQMHMKEIDASPIILDSVDRLVAKFDDFSSIQMYGHCEELFNNIITDCGTKVYFQLDAEFKGYFSGKVSLSAIW